MRDYRFDDKDGSPAKGNAAPQSGDVPSAPAEAGQGKEDFLTANRKYIVPAVVTLLGIGLIALFAAFSHRPSIANTATVPNGVLHTTTPGTPLVAAPSNLPTDLSKPKQQADRSAISPAVVQGTASSTTNEDNKEDLGTVKTFQSNPNDPGGNKIWSAPPYALATNGGGGGYGGGGGGGQESSNNIAQARVAQVSKPSLVFVLSASGEGGGETGKPHTSGTAEDPVITNLGYQPGDHIATHLEAVATTATKAPVIAVVDYNYQRNGVTVVPAGSRILGTISEASSTGIMDIHFTSIHLPNGEDIPVSAMGLNTQMGPLVGAVTGRNRGKQFLLAAMSGLGQTTALFGGNSNVTGTLSEGDMIRAQAAQNIGQAADSSISQLSVTEHLIVTVPAGTRVEVTFTAPEKTKKPTQM
jgi:hypothetical protein